MIWGLPFPRRMPQLTESGDHGVHSRGFTRQHLHACVWTKQPWSGGLKHVGGLQRLFYTTEPYGVHRWTVWILFLITVIMEFEMLSLKFLKNKTQETYITTFTSGWEITLPSLTTTVQGKCYFNKAENAVVCASPPWVPTVNVRVILNNECTVNEPRRVNRQCPTPPWSPVHLCWDGLLLVNQLITSFVLILVFLLIGANLPSHLVFDR